jgi:ATP phosphoribosyltransferase-like protein
VVLESQAVLIRTPVPIREEKQEWTRRLLMRIDGVEQVKGSKYIMLHAPRSALPAIAKLLPGSEAPTVIPLEGLGDRVAVHAVCRENVFWETLEDLKGVGASSVLVLPGREDAGLNGTRSPMRIFDWNSLSPAERRSALQRPAQRDAKGVAAAARHYRARRQNGDAALRELTEKIRRCARLSEAAGDPRRNSPRPNTR